MNDNAKIRKEKEKEIIGQGFTPSEARFLAFLECLEHSDRDFITIMYICASRAGEKYDEFVDILEEAGVTSSSEALELLYDALTDNDDSED